VYQPSSLSGEVPPTIIEDTTTTTLDMGEAYLWANLLCIKQIDIDDKVIFVPRMDEI
jgi:hypothetical protein